MPFTDLSKSTADFVFSTHVIIIIRTPNATHDLFLLASRVPDEATGRKRVSGMVPYLIRALVTFDRRDFAGYRTLINKRLKLIPDL